MSLTATPRGAHHADRPVTAPSVSPEEFAQVADAPSRLSGKWPIAGFVAAVSAFLFTGIGSKYYEQDVTDKGVDGVYEHIKDGGVLQHVAMDLAFLAAITLGLFAAGFVRFIASRTPAGSGASSLAKIGMTGAVTLTVLIASFKAIYRGGLPDHMDSAMYTKDSVAVLDVVVGQLQYTALWPLALVMCAVLALVFKHRTLPRWYGVVTGLFLTGILLMAFVLGLPYFAGLVGPIWLAVSAAVVLRHRARPVGIAL